MGKRSKRNRINNRLYDHEAIIAEISQKSMELKEVQSDLQLQKNKWADTKYNGTSDNGNDTTSVNKASQVKYIGFPEHPSNADAALNAINLLEKKCLDIEKGFSKAMSNLYELEQYMRRQNLLIYGLDDIPSETYDFEFVRYICRKLNNLLPNLEFGEITPDDINDAHPMYTRSGSKVIVIVQFNKRWIRNEVLKMKNNLTQKNVSFSEHLTPNNMKLLKAAKSIAGPYYAFSRKGVVYGRVDDKKIAIKSEQDLEELKSLVETAHATHKDGVQIPPAKKTEVPSTSRNHQSLHSQNESGTSKMSMAYAEYDGPYLSQNYATHTFRGRGTRGRGRGSFYSTTRGSYHRGRGNNFS